MRTGLVLPNFGDITEFTGIDNIKNMFLDSSPMYARMDLEIQPAAAKGSYQCRVVSKEKTEIRTFLFLDDSDKDYSPAVISLAQFQHDLKVRL